MKKFYGIGSSLLALQLNFSCSQQPVDTAGTPGGATGNNNQTAVIGPVLRLTWSASTGTTTEYHVYGLTEEKNSGGKEFASLTVSTANKAAPAVDVDLGKTTLPKTGKVCFYVIAENNGANSPASTPACVTL